MSKLCSTTILIILENLFVMEKFEFSTIVRLIFDKDCNKSTLKRIYNDKTGCNRGKSTEETRKMGVYALYENDNLMKIGQAADRNGVFHRVSQYYRGRDGKCSEINTNNRDNITIEYVNFDTVEDCWSAERLLQGIAHKMGEAMPWEKKGRS